MSALNHRKRDLNSELNVTPFIDLLSTIVCFLLITAVWIQVATIDIKQSHGTDAAPSKKDSYDISFNYRNLDRAQLILKRNGKNYRRKNVRAKSHDELIEKSKAIVTSWIGSGKKKRNVQSAFVKPVKAIEYGQMIEALDLFRENKIINIGVVAR